MKLTKYEHACFTLEKEDQVLVVDPGQYTTDFVSPERVVAVVITHDHPDHFDKEQITAIVDKNPEVVIVSVEGITSQLETPRIQTVNAGDTYDAGPFHLEFFGGKHAEIHRDLPGTANIGVLVDELLYYPGDSLVLPGRPVDTLALPAAAPWMMIGQAMDFLTEIKPRLAFPTHDAILSKTGKQLADTMLGMYAKKVDAEYKRLEEPVEI